MCSSLIGYSFRLPIFSHHSHETSSSCCNVLCDMNPKTHRISHKEYFLFDVLTIYPLCSYLIASLGLQITWSFVLALIDAYALVKNKALQNSLLISLFVVGDWASLH